MRLRKCVCLSTTTSSLKKDCHFSVYMKIAVQFPRIHLWIFKTKPHFLLNRNGLSIFDQLEGHAGRLTWEFFPSFCVPRALRKRSRRTVFTHCLTSMLNLSLRSLRTYVKVYSTQSLSIHVRRRNKFSMKIQPTSSAHFAPYQWFLRVYCGFRVDRVRIFNFPAYLMLHNIYFWS